MTNLTIGDKAPQFNGIDENGSPISLADFKGKNVILYFYPKDMTPGCTTQSCNLRDSYSDLTQKGFDVIGVSADSPARHLKFIAKHELPFHLIADEDRTILNAYGVWGLKKFMGKEYDGIHRTTFVINEDGVITSVIKKVKTKDHANQILADLENQ